jgi:hypothetical protein
MVRRLGTFRDRLSYSECLLLAEELRSCADNLDHGAAQRNPPACYAIKELLPASHDAKPSAGPATPPTPVPQPVPSPDLEFRVKVPCDQPAHRRLAARPAKPRAKFPAGVLAPGS